LKINEENSYLIESKLKKSENFSMGVHHGIQHHVVNQTPMPFMIRESILEHGNRPRVQVVIKYLIWRILQIFN